MFHNYNNNIFAKSTLFFWNGYKYSIKKQNIFILTIIDYSFFLFTFASEISTTNFFNMPQISAFYGLIILMNFKDHSPPHFHVWYGDYKVTVTIKEGIVTGNMPQRALKMVFEWLEQHREELLQEWEKAQKGEQLTQIMPLQ